MQRSSLARVICIPIAFALSALVATGCDDSLLTAGDHPDRGDAEWLPVAEAPSEDTKGPNNSPLWESPTAVPNDGAGGNSGLGPPYPIVLVHGFSGFRNLGPLGYFFGIADDLTSLGYDVYAPTLPQYAPPSVRGRILAAAIDDILARTGKARVHLIAHSQGGLDSRYLVSSLGYAEKIASLTTISTPHRGSEVADAFRYLPGGSLNVAGQYLAWFFGAAAGPPDASDLVTHGHQFAAEWDPRMADVIFALSSQGAAQFNRHNPDPVGLPIFSVGGVSNLLSTNEIEACKNAPWGQVGSGVDAIDPLIVPLGMLISYSGGGNLFHPRPNDGFVALESAMWGQFLNCIPTNHLNKVGQIGDFGPGLFSRFDHRELYRRLAANCRDVEAHEAAAP